MLLRRQDLPKPYPNPYNEGEYFSPSDVQRGQELISSNIPLGLGSAPISPMAQPTRMPTMIPSPMSQPMPEQQDDDSGRFLASLIAQGAAGFGTGMTGGSAADIQRSAGTFQTMRDTQENQRRAKLLTDPTSEESKKRREVYKSLGYQVPNNLSATDLNDPTVLQTLKTQMQEQKLAAMPRGGIGVGVTKKQEKITEIDKDDIKKISAMADLNNSIDNLISSVEKHGKARFGEEALNQNDLKYSIAASSGVIKGQGAMTESDINFWDNVLSPSATGSKEDYINRMKKKKSEYVNGITKSLELKGYTVKPTADGKYTIFDKNENFVGQY